MYIKINDLFKQLDKSWSFYKDLKGNTIYQLLAKCEKFDSLPQKQTRKKKEVK